MRTAELAHTVRAQDCASAWANDLPVLATPVLLWLAELACMRAVADGLAPDEMTVGVAHRDAEHLAPTPQGWTVTMTARELGTDARGVCAFAVEATDGHGTVYRGIHERATVERDRFLRRLERRAGAAGPVDVSVAPRTAS